MKDAEKMKHSDKIVLGLATAWPIAYIILFILLIFRRIFMTFLEGPLSLLTIPVMFLSLFPFHFMTIISIWVLLVFYIVHIFNNDNLPQDNKVIWVIVVFLGSTVGMFIYWYICIWQESKVQ